MEDAGTEENYLRAEMQRPSIIANHWRRNGEAVVSKTAAKVGSGEFETRRFGS